jgi:hypothetical protein
MATTVGQTQKIANRRRLYLSQGLMQSDHRLLHDVVCLFPTVYTVTAQQVMGKHVQTCGSNFKQEFTCRIITRD